MIYLAKPTGDILGRPNGLREETCKMKKTLTDMWELTFEVSKYVDENNKFSPSDFYESLSQNMYLLLESDTANALFLIDAEPVVTGDGIQETKSVTAHTAECELQQKFLRSFYINNGTGESQEYLADGNLDAYTGLPKEYISLANFEHPGLSLLHLALQETGWTVDDSLKTAEADACARKYQFSVDGKDIYSFLMSEVAPTAKILFFFDRRKRRVSFRSYPNIGKDTGICIGLRNLASRIQVESTADAALITRYRPSCESGSGLGIEYVNFGDPYLYNLDYFAATRNEYGDYKYVTESFHNQYAAWNKKREDLRPDYIALTKEYNQTLLAISELQNRLPDDGCSIDYKTYKADELYLSLNTYEKALAALTTLYKNDYPGLYPSPDTALDEAHLRTTMYWHDYYAYKYQIIPSVLEAMKIWYATDKNGNLERDENGRYIVCENGNPAYAGNPAMVKPVTAFLYEFELYGLEELKAKRKAWMECVSLLYRDGFIKSGTKENPTSYQTPDEAGWERLTASQKAQFTTISAFKDTLNSYLDYMAFDSRPNAITGTSCKGIIRLCEAAISERQGEIASLQEHLASVNAERDALSASVLPQNNFNTENLKLFFLLINEADYSSKNIVTTNLDDILTMVDVAETLYQDAKSHLDIASHPQYAFHTTIDNLFALEEFAPLWEDFVIGNFIRLQPDLFRDDSETLRLISIESNPLQTTGDISVEFSTMTRSLSDVNDLAFLFGEGASGSHPSSGSSSGSGGTYGKNDADIQIANNMLNALLKSETFGTQIADVILDSIRTNKGNFGKLIAHSGIFDRLESGEVKINGDCLTNAVKSNNYNGSPAAPLSNTSGTIIDLTSGEFNFGGGKLKLHDDSLLVEGDVIADSLVANRSGTIAGWKFDETGLYKIGENGEKQMVLGDEGICAGESFSVKQDGTCEIKDINELTIGSIEVNPATGITNNCLQIHNGEICASSHCREDDAYGIDLVFGNDGIVVYDAQSPEKHAYDYAKLAMDSLTSGGYLELTKRYKNDSYHSVSEIDHTCVCDANGIRGIQKSVYDYKQHLYDDIIKLPETGSGTIINPDIGMDTDSTISFFPGFSENATYTAYEFAYGQHIRNTYLLENTSSSGSQLRLVESGEIVKYASSSKKYKNHITTQLSDSLNPHRLYSLPVIQFQYKDSYLSPGDQRFGKDIIGFLAEDVNEIYPIACNLKNGEPEVPEYNMLIAPMLKLIQEQHEEIETLKRRLAVLEQNA